MAAHKMPRRHKKKADKKTNKATRVFLPRRGGSSWPFLFSGPLPEKRREVVLPSRYLALLLALFLSPQAALAGDAVDRMMKPLDESIEIRQQTQEQRDDWAEQRPRMESEYESLKARARACAEEVEGLRRQVLSLSGENRELALRKVEAEKMEKELLPFLESAVLRLEDLIRDSDPFLPEERKARLALLKKSVSDPELSPGEKYRKTMEAFFIEADYGNTIELTRASVGMDGAPVRVDVLRLGRLGLFCQSLDKSRYGAWDPATRSWRWLAGSRSPELARAFGMAGKRRPLDIVAMPLGKVAAP